jgi:hypothetical protein
MESAHVQAGEPLTEAQTWSLDVLDAILDTPDVQFRTMMHDGDILVAADQEILHARTPFADRLPGGAADAADAEAKGCRFFDRVWAQRRS